MARTMIQAQTSAGFATSRCDPQRETGLHIGAQLYIPRQMEGHLAGAADHCQKRHCRFQNLSVTHKITQQFAELASVGAFSRISANSGLP